MVLAGAHPAVEGHPAIVHVFIIESLDWHTCVWVDRQSKVLDRNSVQLRKQASVDGQRDHYAPFPAAHRVCRDCGGGTFAVEAESVEPFSDLVLGQSGGRPESA
jgi:hypothetical protein